MALLRELDYREVVERLRASASASTAFAERG
jgi:hypothetical protein